MIIAVIVIMKQAVDLGEGVSEPYPPFRWKFGKISKGKSTEKLSFGAGVSLSSNAGSGPCSPTFLDLPLETEKL